MHSSIEIDDAASSRGTGSAVRRAALACAALFMASILALAVTPAQSAENDLPKLLSTKLPRFGADAAKALGVPDLKQASTGDDNGLALPYPKLDRLYQIYNLNAPQIALAIVERDLGTFALTRTLVIPQRWGEMANGSNGAEWITSFDYRNDRLYIWDKPQNGTLASVESNLPGFIGLNLHDFTYSDSRFPNFGAGLGGLTLNLVGLEFDETTDTLLVLQAAVHSVNSLGNSLMLTGWKTEDLLHGGQLPQVTPRPIRACRRDPINDSSTSLYLTPILVSQSPDVDDSGKLKTFVMVPCFSTTYSTNVVIVRMNRDTALDPTSNDEKAVVAPAGVANWAVDTSHGRLYLVNNSAETDAWVYEAASNAFVGIIALSPRGRLEATSLSLGVDEASGRLYGRSQSYGLMIAAAAQDPVPQADVYPRLSAASSYRLLVDAKRNRVLSLPGTSTGNDALAPNYEVIAVPAPLPAPPRDDPDSRTAQVDEAEGRTVRQFGGNASAYALRVLLARGVSGAVPSNGNDQVGALYTNVDSYCGFTDRELVLARVSKTELSNTSRFSRAAAVDLDNATVVDLESPSRCDIYNTFDGGFPASAVTPFLKTNGVLSDADKKGVPASQNVNKYLGPDTRWDYTAADCSTENGDDETGPNSERVAGPTHVDCSKDDEIAASAQSRLKPNDSLDITVNRATSSTNVKIDKTKGLVSTATARLEGIRIGEYSIGYIENTATAFAKGRTGSAGTVFNKPRIGYVEGPDIPACTDACDLDKVLGALNNALAGRVEFRRITPETRLAKGSPGGYEAGILKSEKQQASDNSLSGDKSVEIPALEMVVYNDNATIGRARQVYQFAGVRADSHYGIQLGGIGSDECLSCVPDIGSTLDVDTGAIATGAVLPNEGEPLAVRIPGGDENVLRRAIRQSAAGANYSLRIIFSNPREALLMATVWLLMWAPFVSARRRRALKAVITADPEGPQS